MITVHSYFPDRLLTDEEYKKYRKEIGTNWKQKMRKYIGRLALKDIYYESKEGCYGKMIFDGGKLKGVVTYQLYDKYVLVLYLATGEKGYGKRLINEVIKTARLIKKYVYIENALDDSVDFYKKIGGKYKKKDIFNTITFNP